MKMVNLKLQIVVLLTLCVGSAFGQNSYVVNPPTGGPGPVNVILRDTTGAYVNASAGSPTIADGADVTQGAKADARSTATDTTPATIVSILKELSFMAQTPAALPANQSVNEAQINGVAVTMGNGVSGTGVQRVTIASDSTGNLGVAQASTTASEIGPLAQGAVTTAAPSYTTAQTDPLSLTTVGSLRMDLSTINQGVTLLTGTGNTGTGSPRVTLSTDNAGLQNWGHKATGSGVPSAAVYQGLIATTANPTNATAGNLVGAMADKAGRLVTTVGNVRELVAVQQTNVATTGETTIVTAAGAGVFADISEIIVTTAGAAAQTITVKDATAGTTRMVLNYPNAALAPGQPLVIPFLPLLPQAAANNNWTVTQSAATACNYTVVYVKNL